MARGLRSIMPGVDVEAVTRAGRSDPAGPVSTSAAAVSTAADVDAAIDSLVAAPPPLLVVVDFDGTLAVGSRDPAVARIEPLAQRALRRLGRHRDRAARTRSGVAVLTGRIVADVAARVRVGGIEYLGDHGLQHGLPRREAARAGRLAVDDRPGVRRPSLTRPRRWRRASPASSGQPAWLFVERKGPSVAFHVRQADDVAAARAAVVEAIGAVERRLGLVHGLAHYRGRSVVDLRPREAGGKREAVERLIARHRPGGGRVLGDEMSDIDAFEAVIAARDTGPPGSA